MSGLVHLYYGEGKGKTTSAAGMALRAIDAGYKVFVLRFLKCSGSGEVNILKSLGAKVYDGKTVDGFTSSMSDHEREVTRQRQDMLLKQIFEEVSELSVNGIKTLIILDELTQACKKGLADGKLAKKCIEERPDGTEIVITGRDPEEWMFEISDYITENVNRKHPYEKGIRARRGVEY